MATARTDVPDLYGLYLNVLSESNQFNFETGSGQSFAQNVNSNDPLSSSPFHSYAHTIHVIISLYLPYMTNKVERVMAMDPCFSLLSLCHVDLVL